MKIVSPQHVFKPAPDLSAKKTHGPAGTAFADALGKAMTPDGPGQKTSAPVSPGPASISGVQFSAIPVSPAVNTAEKVDRLLDLLEGYQRQLADPGRSLKSISPHLDQIEKGGRELEKTIQKMDDADGLKTIAQEALITAAAEVFKFNRGDYNPA